MLPKLNIMRQSCLFLVLYSLCLMPALAEIYTWTDDEGNTVYSDQPHPAANKLTLPPAQTYRAQPAPPPSFVPNNKQQSPSYERIEITQPTNDMTIRDNEGRVTVTIAISPALHNKDTVTLRMDGKVMASNSTARSFTLDNVDRGSHSLVAEIHNAGGTLLLQSKAVTFHLHRVSTLQRRAP